MSQSFSAILSQIKAGKFAPLYYLHGEETYFIDKLVEALDTEGAVLQPGEADFNRSQLFGPDTSAAQLASACRSFPVMAQRRLVLLKEAHRMPKAELDKLESYLKQPAPSTVLVMAFKDRKVALPKAAAEAAARQGVVFQAKKLYDSDVVKWADQYIRDSGFLPDASVANVLVANLGPQLHLIENELEKMFINLRAAGQQQLSEAFVYQMIQVDKAFNVFELIHALSERNAYRAHLIADRLTQNVKLNPPALLLSSLFQFFHQVALVHRHQLRDANAIKNQLGVNYYQARDYAEASRRFAVAQTYRNLLLIRDADLQLKGIRPTLMDERHIFKTLVFQMLQP
jgi:DNA polymerase-3 subunit delta